MAVQKGIGSEGGIPQYKYKTDSAMDSFGAVVLPLSVKAPTSNISTCYFGVVHLKPPLVLCAIFLQFEQHDKKTNKPRK
jgi:hypothetical protein